MAVKLSLVWTKASKLSQKETHLLWSPSNFFNSSFGNLTSVFLRTDEKEFDVEAEGDLNFICWRAFRHVHFGIYIWTHTLWRQSNSQLNIFSGKSARSISPSISSSATRSRISASSCRRVFSFCCRLFLCCFSLISCSRTWEMSPPPRTSITDEIIRFALDLCPARCHRFSHNATQLHSQLVRSIRFYPANNGPCRRIWTELYLTVFKGSFLRLQEEVFAEIHMIFQIPIGTQRSHSYVFLRRKHNTFSDLPLKA